MKIFELYNIKIGVDSYMDIEMSLPPREREKKAVLRVFERLTGVAVDTISHYDDGAPFIAGSDLKISVSHCRSHVAVAISACDSAFGIDIEQWRQQLDRVKEKFLSPASLSVWAINNESLLRAWTLMEATYKAARIKGLDIKKQIKMIPVSTDQSGNMPVVNGRIVVTHNEATTNYHFTSILLDSDLVFSRVANRH